MFLLPLQPLPGAPSVQPTESTGLLDIGTGFRDMLQNAQQHLAAEGDPGLPLSDRPALMAMMAELSAAVSEGDDSPRQIMSVLVPEDAVVSQASGTVPLGEDPVLPVVIAPEGQAPEENGAYIRIGKLLVENQGASKDIVRPGQDVTLSDSELADALPVWRVNFPTQTGETSEDLADANPQADGVALFVSSEGEASPVHSSVLLQKNVQGDSGKQAESLDNLNGSDAQNEFVLIDKNASNAQVETPVPLQKALPEDDHAPLIFVNEKAVETQQMSRENGAVISETAQDDQRVPSGNDGGSTMPATGQQERVAPEVPVMSPLVSEVHVPTSDDSETLDVDIPRSALPNVQTTPTSEQAPSANAQAPVQPDPVSLAPPPNANASGQARVERDQQAFSSSIFVAENGQQAQQTSSSNVVPPVVNATSEDNTAPSREGQRAPQVIPSGLDAQNLSVDLSGDTRVASKPVLNEGGNVATPQRDQQVTPAQVQASESAMPQVSQSEQMAGLAQPQAETSNMRSAVTRSAVETETLRSQLGTARVPQGEQESQIPLAGQQARVVNASPNQPVDQAEADMSVQTDRVQQNGLNSAPTPNADAQQSAAPMPQVVLDQAANNRMAQRADAQTVAPLVTQNAEGRTQATPPSNLPSSANTQQAQEAVPDVEAQVRLSQSSVNANPNAQRVGEGDMQAQRVQQYVASDQKPMVESGQAQVSNDALNRDVAEQNEFVTQRSSQGVATSVERDVTRVADRATQNVSQAVEGDQQTVFVHTDQQTGDQPRQDSRDSSRQTYVTTAPPPSASEQPMAVDANAMSEVEDPSLNLDRGRDESQSVERIPGRPEMRVDMTSPTTRPVSTTDVSSAQLDAMPSEQIDRQFRVSEQVIRSARVMSRDGATEVTMRLDPKELGEVTIRLSTQDQVVRGEIAVENQKVQEIVQRHMGALRESLAGQGIQLDDIHVSVQDRGAQTDRETFRDNLDRQSEGQMDREQSQSRSHSESRWEQAERQQQQTADGRVDFVA